MSEKVKAILPKDYCVGEISLSTALGEVLGGDKMAAGYYDRALAKLVRGATGDYQMCFTRTNDVDGKIAKVTIIINSGLNKQTIIEVGANSFLVKGQDGEVIRFRSRLVMPPPATLDTDKLLPFHSQAGNTLYLGVKREHGRGIYDEKTEVRWVVVAGGSFA